MGAQERHKGTVALSQGKHGSGVDCVKRILGSKVIGNVIDNVIDNVADSIIRKLGVVNSQFGRGPSLYVLCLLVLTPVLHFADNSCLHPI